MPKKVLNPKQLKLIEAYKEHGNIALAARESGYGSRQAAHYFLTNHDEAKKKIETEREEINRQAMHRKFEIKKQAQAISEKLFLEKDYRAAVKALEFEARLLRMFDEKIIIEAKTESNSYDFSKLSVQELERLRELLAKCGGGSHEYDS